MCFSPCGRLRTELTAGNTCASYPPASGLTLTRSIQQQWERVREAVEYAFIHCPHYQERFAGAGFDGTLRDRRDFRRLPLLTKRDIRENGDRLLSREFRREDLVETRTGGSTGVALNLYFDKRCQELRNAAAMRSDHWAGWDIGMKVAALWGNPPVADTLKKKLRNLLLRSYHLSGYDEHRRGQRPSLCP